MAVSSDPSIAFVSDEESETRRQLEEIAADAFPTPQDYFLSLSSHTLAARIDGDFVGGVVLDSRAHPTTKVVGSLLFSL